MPRATTAAASFTSSRHVLSDGSSVFNLRLWTHDGMWIDIAEMAIEADAIQCADIMTNVLRRFIECGSNHEMMSLAVALDNALKSVARS